MTYEKFVFFENKGIVGICYIGKSDKYTNIIGTQADRGWPLILKMHYYPILENYAILGYFSFYVYIVELV